MLSKSLESSLFNCARIDLEKQSPTTLVGTACLFRLHIGGKGRLYLNQAAVFYFELMFTQFANIVRIVSDQ